MMNTNLEAALPDDITAPFAWDAFDHITQRTDWRPRVASRDPLAFTLEYDEAFAAWLADDASWRLGQQARHWITNRIRQIVFDDFNKTTVRRASLQVRDDENDTDLERGVKERVISKLRHELHCHFDQSIPEWEREAFNHWASITDTLDQQRFRAFVGLDQLVPEDVARKALKYVLHRLHWGIVGEPSKEVFWGDHVVRDLSTRRYPRDDTERARALVLRAAEAIYEEWDARRKAGEDVHRLTKFAIRDTILQRYEDEGWWGPIHLALHRDRVNYRLTPPDLTNSTTADLIARQEPRLFMLAA